jgi:hypothetical protein
MLVAMAWNIDDPNMETAHSPSGVEVGITQLHADEALTNTFGVAPATIRYRGRGNMTPL